MTQHLKAVVGGLVAGLSFDRHRARHPLHSAAGTGDGGGRRWDRTTRRRLYWATWLLGLVIVIAVSGYLPFGLVALACLALFGLCVVIELTTGESWTTDSSVRAASFEAEELRPSIAATRAGKPEVGAGVDTADRGARNGEALRDGFADGVLGTEARLARHESSTLAVREYHRGVAAVNQLSDEERLVLASRAQGLVPAAIADRLHLPDSRVRAVLRRLKNVGAVE
jgi:hypothetical protein